MKFEPVWKIHCLGRSIQTLRTAVFIFFVMTICGCSFRESIIDQVRESVAQTGEVYATDDDPELVATASPFGLKLIEGMLADAPRHQGLLLAAVKGFTQYAYAFVELPAQEIEEENVDAAYAAHQRAKNIFLRARDYGLRGLDISYAGFREKLLRDPDALLKETKPKDVPFMYWTSVSWAAAISLSKDDPGMLAALPIIQKLAFRALTLDESFDHGAIHVFLISLAMNQPLKQEERVDLARSHFRRAVDLSSGHQASPFVTYAESVCIPTGNREEFRQMLTLGLKVDSRDSPSWRLENKVFQRRARWLNSHIDQFFAE